MSSIPVATDWLGKPPAEVLTTLQSREAGLASGEVEERQKKFGANKLPEAKRESYLKVLWRQFQSPLIYILLIAALLIFFISKITDGLIILFILLFNALVGMIQEGRAQATLLALKKNTETKAVVRRDNKEEIIDDSQLVPGDIVLVHEGDRVPADGRLLIAHNLKIDESTLTGESVPVHKTIEDSGMIFQGTYIVSGKGVIVVTAIGSQTAIGQIAQKISSIDTDIPLKKDLELLMRWVVAVIGLLILVIFFSGLLRGNSVLEMLAVIIAVVVSAIPEGLPIVLTVVLAGGVWRMNCQHVLVKKLLAVEALGEAKIIAVDKTGTITKNQLIVRRIYLNDKMYDVSGDGYEPRGEITTDGQKVDTKNQNDWQLLGQITAFCSSSRPVFLEKEQRWQAIGDPTETALAVLAEKLGYQREKLEEKSPLLKETPFDYQTKCHTTIHQIDGQPLLTVAGAPEVVLRLCRLTDQRRRELTTVFHQLSQQGQRIIALAANDPLIFVGFLAMEDSLRPGVREAVARTQAAGVRVVMITGDHAITAQAIATEAGIYHEGESILTGQEIGRISIQELASRLPGISVFARVTPIDKLKIIQAFRRRGEIIAMTGDGVNDAPSLVAADLGIGMGQIGSEVAKEAADIVLLNDDFSQIVGAIEEGRHIFKTIKKVILYLFSTNFGEILVIVGALFLGYPLPILAAQIIWLNLVTDGFLDVALAMEPKEKGLLAEEFRRPSKLIFDKLMVKRLLVMALPMMLGTLWLFSRYFAADLTKALTISLTTMAVFQWFNAWNCRSERASIFRMNPFSNLWLVSATVIIVCLQLLAVYNPWFQQILHTASLAAGEWLIIIAIASTIIIAEEVRKFSLIFSSRNSIIK